jgi:transposase
MGCLSIIPHLSFEQIKERLYQCRNGHHASYWQIILTLSLNPGRKPNEYASLLGCSERKLYRIRSLYNRQGPELIDKLSWGGRREQRCVMSFRGEEELLQSQVAMALRGEVLVAGQLRSAVEQKVGHSVSDDYLWDLLKRHGWSKKVPRPQHPKAEKEVNNQRDAFKKKRRNSLAQTVKSKCR